LGNVYFAPLLSTAPSNELPIAALTQSIENDSKHYKAHTTLEKEKGQTA